jgi:hypothetical protein
MTSDYYIARARSRLTDRLRTHNKQVINPKLITHSPETTRTHTQLSFTGFTHLPDLTSLIDYVKKQFQGTVALVRNPNPSSSEPIFKVFIPRTYTYYSTVQVFVLAFFFSLAILSLTWLPAQRLLVLLVLPSQPSSNLLLLFFSFLLVLLFLLFRLLLPRSRPRLHPPRQ